MVAPQLTCTITGLDPGTKYSVRLRAYAIPAGPSAASLAAKVTTKRNEDLAALLKSDADKAKLAENIKNMPQGRGRGPGAL